MALTSIHAGNTLVESEMLEENAIFAELADRLRIEGPAALDDPLYDDLFLADMSVEEFIEDLLIQYPAIDALPAAA